jgi:CRAL/TRIO domain.
MIGKCDIDRLVKELSSEELNHYFIMYNECMSQILDEVTRRENRLTKLVKVFDEEDIKVSFKILKSVGKYVKASQIAEDFYPQLVGAMILINCNSWVVRLWKLIKPLVPKRLLEKISVVGKPTSSNMSLLRDYVSEENIPLKYGGLNTQWPNVTDVAKLYEKVNSSNQ